MHIVDLGVLSNLFRHSLVGVLAGMNGLIPEGGDRLGETATPYGVIAIEYSRIWHARAMSARGGQACVCWPLRRAESPGGLSRGRCDCKSAARDGPNSA